MEEKTMKTPVKHLLALILAMAMGLSLFSAGVWAEDLSADCSEYSSVADQDEAVAAQEETVASVTTNGTTTNYADLAAAAAAWAKENKSTLTVLADYAMNNPFAVPANHTLVIAQNVTVNGTGSITNKGTIIAEGTLDTSKGSIDQAGTVNIASTGTLKLSAPLPTTADMTVSAGGQVAVAMPDGVKTFIGKTGTASIATLDEGTLNFHLTPDANTYTLAKDSKLSVNQWDTGNALFGTTTKLVDNKGSISVPGAMLIGQNTTLKNEGTISIIGTLDGTLGTIDQAGTVVVASTGNLNLSAPLPTTADMTVSAGGQVAVAMPDGVKTFIGKTGTASIATLDEGILNFHLTPDANTYTLAEGSKLSVNQWDTGNALFGTTTKLVDNKGSISVPGAMIIGQNTTLNNAGTISVTGTLGSNKGTIALTSQDAFVEVFEKTKGALTVENSDGGIHSGTGAEAKTVYSYSAPVVEKKSNSISVKDVSKSYSDKQQKVKLNASAKGGAKLSYKSDSKDVTVNSKGEVTIKAKFVGKAAITITAAETDSYKKAEKKVTITVNPTGTKPTSAKAGKGKITLKWKKNVSAKGYEVQYSTNKKFSKGNKTVKVEKGSTTSTTIKAKKGTYYVRIRTVNGKTHSGWSASKTVKVK